jgi:hypothetical protein
VLTECCLAGELCERERLAEEILRELGLPARRCRETPEDVEPRSAERLWRQTAREAAQRRQREREASSAEGSSGIVWLLRAFIGAPAIETLTET